MQRLKPWRGIPLITSDCRGTREYMEEQVTGYVCVKNSVNEYVQAIANMIKHQKKAQMSQACRKQARHFDIQETDKIMRSVYKKMSEK